MAAGSEANSKKNSVLIVDDERSNISVLKNILCHEYVIYASTNGSDAIETAKAFLPDLILLDILMPQMDGFAVIAELKNSKETRAIPVIFITGLNDREAEKKGLSAGAVDYIPKPFDAAIVKLRVQNQLSLVNNARTLQNQAERLLRLRNSMTSTLATVVENRDKTTGKHIARTAAYLEIMLKAMIAKGVYSDEVANWDLDNVISSSRLHDIGKIAVSDLILNKPGKLTDDEFAIMKSHTTYGEKVIDEIISEAGEEDFLLSAKLFAGNHHEKWNGTGYPRGLKGTDIPLYGRVLALVDVYDALTSVRPYKTPFTHEKARQIIFEGKANHFDPKIVDVFMGISDSFDTLNKTCKGDAS